MSSTSTSSRTVLSEALQRAVARRVKQLRGTFDRLGIDAMLVSGEHDIKYLTGFCGHDTELLILPDRAFIITDSRYDTSLEPWRDFAMFDVVMGIRHRLTDSVRSLAGDAKIKRLGVQADRLTVVRHRSLTTALADFTLVDTADVVATLRMKKDDLEVRMIERAIQVHHEALTATVQDITLGMTEAALYARLDYEMKKRGATAPSFNGIVGAGPNSALPHHETGDTPITEGILLIDTGAVVDGYCSDITRTFGVVSLSDQLRGIYDIVLEAQLAAIAFAKPGVTCAATDKAARDVIERAGYGEYFGHGLGHGMGMDVHEPPYFNSLETDTVLEPGMIMTFEPGIYIPGVGGVRIEDDVVITEGGNRVLSSWPKLLDEIMLDPSARR